MLASSYSPEYSRHKSGTASLVLLLEAIHVLDDGVVHEVHEPGMEGFEMRLILGLKRSLRGFKVSS